MISPLLSNIYPHPLDLYWEREVKATKMVRYADDLVVLCRWKPLETYMPKLRQFLARLRVTINEDKTHVRFDKGALRTELWNGLRHRRRAKAAG